MTIMLTGGFKFARVRTLYVVINSSKSLSLGVFVMKDCLDLCIREDKAWGTSGFVTVCNL